VTYTLVFHWWPDCPVWPDVEDPNDASPYVHAVAHTPEAVTCERCKKEAAIDRADHGDGP
jgi:hypothetical protein